MRNYIRIMKAEQEQEQEQEANDKYLYLRKAGAPIGNRYLYTCANYSGSVALTVFATSRDLAKAEVWRRLGKAYPFWR